MNQETYKKRISSMLPAGFLILVISLGIFASDFRIAGYRDPALDLPGARMIHIAPQEAARYRWLSGVLRPNCDILFTMPGMGSLNLWSGVPTPNGFNLTAWMQILDQERQLEILEILRAHPQSCVVDNPALVEFWMSGRTEGLSSAPLPRYIRNDMRVAAETDGYQIRVSPNRTSPFSGQAR